MFCKEEAAFFAGLCQTGEETMFLKNVALTSGVAAAFMLAGASAASAFTACQVTDVGGIDDSGFNQTAWKGVQDSMAAYGIDGRYLDCLLYTSPSPRDRG